MGICFLCLFGTDVACLEYGVWSRWSLMFSIWWSVCYLWFVPVGVWTLEEEILFWRF